jgi:hypothetical protein
MLNCFMKRPLINNNGLRDYCNKSTKESIRKLTEKHKLERIDRKFETLLDDDDSDEFHKFYFLHLLLFISISSITIYFYKRLK